MNRLRQAALGILGGALLLGLAGCPGRPTDPDSSDTFGILEVDARRDGDKKAFHYSFVIYPIDRTNTDPEFVVTSEPTVEWDQVPLRYSLPPGRYGLDIFAYGACYRGKDIVVETGRTTQYRCQLEPGGAIEGIVVGPSSGKPLPGVLVFRPLDRGYGLDSDNWDPKKSTEASQVCRTTEEGYYRLENLPPGEHTIVYYMPELGWSEKKVEVLDGKKLVLNPVTVGKH